MFIIKLKDMENSPYPKKDIEISGCRDADFANTELLHHPSAYKEITSKYESSLAVPESDPVAMKELYDKKNGKSTLVN